LNEIILLQNILILNTVKFDPAETELILMAVSTSWPSMKTKDEQVFSKELGSRIASARKALHRTQQEVADHLGIAQATVPKQAQEVLQEFAKNVASNDRLRFYAVVETELNGLHEGNIIRYRLGEEVWRAWRT
jgi:hypothetical protein